MPAQSCIISNMKPFVLAEHVRIKKILCHYLKKEIILFHNFVLWFCVFPKSQPSCAITGEVELSLGENVCLYHDGKKTERRK